MGKRMRLGLALCGAFGAFDEVVETAKRLIAQGYELTPIFSDMAATAATRFGRAADKMLLFESLCGEKAVCTVAGAEATCLREELDLLLIAPCTGNTLAKLCHGFADTAVTMAAKCQLRAKKPVLIALYTDDPLGVCPKQIALQLCREHIYFSPMRREGEAGAPRLRADFDRVPEAVKLALAGEGIRPVYL